MFLLTCLLLRLRIEVMDPTLIARDDSSKEIVRGSIKFFTKLCANFCPICLHIDGQKARNPFRGHLRHMEMVMHDGVD